MSERIQQIRGLLSELEVEMASSESIREIRDFSALELPSIIQQIVDDLQPLLSPYEVAFYWYFFRHSIGANGAPHLRFSTRSLRTCVVKSSYSQAKENTISLHKVTEVLLALEAIGAIRKDGETNRIGTPYRIFVPEEIDACRKFRAERTAVAPVAEVDPSQVDFYNIRENRKKIFERDEYICRYCKKQLTRFTATLDHITPVAENGDNSFENLVTSCLDCNSRKNKRALADFLAEQ